MEYAGGTGHKNIGTGIAHSLCILKAHIAVYLNFNLRVAVFVQILPQAADFLFSYAWKR